MEIIILLILSLFILPRRQSVTFQRGGAGVMGTAYPGSGGAGTAGGGPGAGWVQTMVHPGENIETMEGLAGDTSGTPETLDEEGAATGASTGMMQGVMIGPNAR